MKKHGEQMSEQSTGK